MMDFPAVRRKPATYGKAGRKILVHDLFDVTSFQAQDATEARSAQPNKLSPRRALTPLKKASSGSDVFDDSIRSEGVRQPVSPIQSNPGDKKASRGSPARANQLDLFDLCYSDEDSTRSGQSNFSNKRRKMTSKANASQAPKNLRMSKTKVNASTNRGGIHSDKVEERSKKPTRAQVENTDTEMTDDSNNMPKPLRKPTLQKSLPRPASKAIVKRAKGSGHSSKPASNSSQSEHGEGLSPGQLSDQSTRSNASIHSTPKRKRNGGTDIPSDMSSPSQLELRMLRLSPEGSPEIGSMVNRSDDSESGVSTPRKRRSRLIDRLDAPQTHDLEDVSMPDVLSKPGIVEIPPPRSFHPKDVTSAPASDLAPMAAPKLQRTASSQSVAVSNRPRATYSKQRSHLSDMVDELDTLNGSGSQMPLSQGSFTSVASQLELDDDIDEPGASGPIKSIHELRQAGAVDRFERDLEVILDDVQAENRSLRLQGLMQLLRKLEDQAFSQHVINGGKVTRMTKWITERCDSMSAWLMIIVLDILVSAQMQSTNNLAEIYKAMQVLAPVLFGEKRRLAKAATDRKQNLSKAMSRDLVEFEQYLLAKPRFESHQSGYICLPLLAIQSLENASRRLISLGAMIPKLTISLLDTTSSLLEESAQQVHNGAGLIEYPRCVRLLLLWLELSSTHSDDWASMITVKLCEILGNALSKVMAWAQSQDLTILQSSLRLIVSMSNNEPRLCEAFGSSQVCDTLFTVVDKGFDQLKNSDPSKEEAGKPEVDGLILALGCLLNFAECDATARTKMLEVGSNGIRKLDRLVDIFNAHVDEIAEVVKEEDSQILAPFGYLSMLLCTLCLDRPILEHVTEMIKDQSLKILFDAVEMFLSLMHFLETDPEDGHSSGGAFTARFLPILETVKQDSR